jgi:hypothetical protein
MMSRKLAVLVAAALVSATTPSIAQTGPNPAPTPEQAPAPQTPPSSDRIDNVDGFFSSDLVFILAAIAVAGALAFLATQVGGDDPESP